MKSFCNFTRSAFPDSRSYQTSLLRPVAVTTSNAQTQQLNHHLFAALGCSKSGRLRLRQMWKYNSPNSSQRWGRDVGASRSWEAPKNQAGGTLASYLRAPSQWHALLEMSGGNVVLVQGAAVQSCFPHLSLFRPRRMKIQVDVFDKLGKLKVMQERQDKPISSIAVNLQCRGMTTRQTIFRLTIWL